MRWDDLQILEAVGSTGSFTSAAEQLGISHSTVSRRLHGLEALHGIRLFRPKGHGIELTDAGQELFEAVRQMADDADIAVLRLSGVDPVVRGVIRFAVTDALAHDVLPRLHEFTAANPELTIELVIGDQVSNLSKNEVDIVLRQCDSPPRDYTGIKVGTTQDAVFGAKSLCGDKDDKTALAELPWVLYADGWGEDWLETQAPKARVAARINSELAVLEAVRAGIGLGFLDIDFATPAPELRQLTPPLPELKLDVWVLIHREHRRSTRLRRFMQFLEQVVPEQLGT